MSALTEPKDGGWPSPEDVRHQTETALRQVMAAGEVARAMWRLLLADRSGHRPPGVEAERWRDAVVDGLAAGAARAVIDASAQQQALGVYLAGVRTAVAGDDPDLAARVLVDLASLHLRIGYPAECRRLLELAETGRQQLCERTRWLLAIVRAWADDYEQRQPEPNPTPSPDSDPDTDTDTDPDAEPHSNPDPSPECGDESP